MVDDGRFGPQPTTTRLHDRENRNLEEPGIQSRLLVLLKQVEYSIDTTFAIRGRLRLASVQLEDIPALNLSPGGALLLLLSYRMGEERVFPTALFRVPAFLSWRHGSRLP